MSNDIMVQKENFFRGLLQKYSNQIESALPRGSADADTVIRIAMTTIKRNPDLIKCEPTSLFGAVVQCCQLGLPPDNMLGMIYIIPFKNNRTGKFEPQIIIGYKGLLDLVRRSGQITDIFVELIYENEDWDYRPGLQPVFYHKPLPPNLRGNKKLAGYSIATFVHGGKSMHFMWADDIYAIRNRSQSYIYQKEKSIWVKDECPMMKKTVLRQFTKYLPQSVEDKTMQWAMKKAVALDEIGEAGVSQKELFIEAGDFVETTSEEIADVTASKTDELKEKLDF